MSDDHLTFFDMSGDLLTFDNAQSHVTAFRPISKAARSWSDDNINCHDFLQVSGFRS